MPLRWGLGRRGPTGKAVGRKANERELAPHRPRAGAAQVPPPVMTASAKSVSSASQRFPPAVTESTRISSPLMKGAQEIKRKEKTMRKRILITGGTGNLGSHVRRQLADPAVAVRIMSRRQPDSGEDQGVEWSVADLVSGEGLAAAVADVDVIVHTASNLWPRSVERAGGRNLLAAARAAGVQHVIYSSILGVDKIDFFYYQDKLEVESMLADSGLGYTILRAAQFHKFVLMNVQAMTKLPIAIQPKSWQFQPIYAGDVAEAIVANALSGPANGIKRIAGPEVLSLDQLMRTWMEVFGQSKPVLRLPVPSGLSRGFRAGHNTSPANSVSGVRWSEYLEALADDAAEPTRRKARAT